MIADTPEQPTARRTHRLELFVAVVVVNFVASLVLGALYSAFLDICDRTHESANTPLGWFVVGIAVLAPGVLAVAQNTRRHYIEFALVCLVVVLIWVKLILPSGSCGV